MPSVLLSPTIRIVCGAATCVAVAPLVLAAQKPFALDRPAAEFREPFTQITSVRELRDGRVLVADPRDLMLQLVDLKAGTATKVGREGSGPGEYGRAQRVLPLPGDTSALYDPLNQRFVLVGPDAKMGTQFFRLETTGGRGAVRGAVPRGSDARGRIYIEGSPWTSTSDGEITPADSAPVLRYDRLTSKSDTVAYAHLAKGNAKVSGGPNGVSMMVGLKAFPARDEWAAMPDGSVAVVRVADYHVDWYSPSGQRASGSPVRVDPIPVTEVDKEDWRAARRAAIAAARGRARGAPSRGTAPPTAALPEPEFPTVKPAFVQGAVFARPNGELWVLRSQKAGVHAPIYDVFNSKGTMIGRVAFPAKTRLLGFGNGTVYTVRIDEDDLEYLQRHSLPNDTKLAG